MAGLMVIFGYIDPGMTSLAIQAIFALVFGVLTGWFLAPWRKIKSLFSRRCAAASDEPLGEGDPELSTNQESRAA